MVWLFTKCSHLSSIGWARSWIRSSAIDRLLRVSVFGVPWAIVSALIASATGSAIVFLVIGLLPWYVWLLDAAVDHYHTNGDLQKLTSRDDVVLATRAEYVGGYPQLPHGRFCYLTLRGTKENPMLTILFPKGVSYGLINPLAPEPDGPRLVPGATTIRTDDTFNVPLLDISRTTEKAETFESLTGQLLASLSEKPGKIFSEERVTLNIQYQGAEGRKHIVELTSFFRGADEVRNWRNYLVCAQAEADTGIKPFAPWKSLRPAPATPEEVPPDDGSGDGSKLQPARRAFERR